MTPDSSHRTTRWSPQVPLAGNCPPPLLAPEVLDIPAGTRPSPGPSPRPPGARWVRLCLRSPETYFPDPGATRRPGPSAGPALGLGRGRHREGSRLGEGAGLPGRGPLFLLRWTQHSPVVPGRIFQVRLPGDPRDLAGTVWRGRHRDAPSKRTAAGKESKGRAQGPRRKCGPVRAGRVLGRQVPADPAGAGRQEKHGSRAPTPRATPAAHVGSSPEALCRGRVSPAAEKGLSPPTLAPHPRREGRLPSNPGVPPLPRLASPRLTPPRPRALTLPPPFSVGRSRCPAAPKRGPTASPAPPGSRGRHPRLSCWADPGEPQTDHRGLPSAALPEDPLKLP
ncbi:basic proline-rich protein-like [Panthera uncia]|uniref:basic proline-rich protein-like n=1 Tax=Panthera uncia TaxID=29064 RepID=UPI0020FFD5BB|nr:basic proline-rich protein-like [Panthera uncia]